MKTCREPHCAGDMGKEEEVTFSLPSCNPGCSPHCQGANVLPVGSTARAPGALGSIPVGPGLVLWAAATRGPHNLSSPQTELLEGEEDPQTIPHLLSTHPLPRSVQV